MGDRELESRLRLEREAFLNTREDEDVLLGQIWSLGERQLTWANDESLSHPGIDSRCITAVQLENRKSTILLPGRKSEMFRSSPEGTRNISSGKKPRPLSTVSIARPGIMPVRPATASELSRIKKALSIGGSEIRILTATTRSHPRIYVTEPDDPDEAGNDVIDDVCCDIRKLFEPNEKENNMNSHSNCSPKSDNFPESKTTLVFPGYDDDHHKFGGESKTKEIQIGYNCNENNEARFKRNTCSEQQYLISNIERNIMNSDTEEDGDDTDEGGIQEDRLMLSPRFDTILQLQEKVRQKRLRIRYNNNSVDFKRPETAPDTLMYNQNTKNSTQTHSPRKQLKSALKKSVCARKSLTRSVSQRKFNVFFKPEGPTLLDIHKQEVEMADYHGKVKEFSKKIIPLKASENSITDYYLSRLLEKQSRGDETNACAMRFVSRSPEIEGARIAKLSRIPSLTFKNVKFDYDSSLSSFESFY